VAIDTDHAAIRIFIDARWDVVGDGSVLVPESVGFRPTAGQKYVLYQIRPIDTAWISPGLSDAIGAVLFSAYGPAAQGPEVTEQLLELAASTVRKKKTGNIQFEDVTPEAIGPDGRGWFIANGRVPYSI
jgi:hypothetical protein